MIKNVALFFSVTDEKTPYKQLLQYETVRNNEVCVLSRCPYSEVFQQVQSSQKKKNKGMTRVLLGALLFGCVVSCGVCNLCLDTYRRNRKTRFDCITEVKNQNLSQVYPWHHTQCVLSHTFKMSDFKDQLFTCAGLPSDNIVEFSCGKKLFWKLILIFSR